MNEYFNKNGRIIIEPYRTDKEGDDKDNFVLNYYKINDKFVYSIQAVLQKRIFTKYPHPNDKLFNSISDCRENALKILDDFCSKNRLKKCWKKLHPGVFWQLDLFDDLE